MMSQKAALLVLLAMSMVVWGCATIVEQELIDEPRMTLEGMSLRHTSLFEATPTFNFKVSNSNPMGMKIRNIAYNFKMNDKKFVKGVADKDIRLRPISSEELSLSVTFNYMDLFSTGAEFLRSDTITYDLSGNMGVGPFALPYRTKGTADLPKLPEMSIKHIDISDFSFIKPFTMVFVLGLKNFCSCPVQLDGLKYRIMLGEKEFANDMLERVSPIDGNGELILRIPVNVTSSELNISENNVSADALSEYELSGEMRFYIRRIGERRFPFQKTGTAPFYARSVSGNS